MHDTLKSNWKEKKKVGESETSTVEINWRGGNAQRNVPSSTGSAEGWEGWEWRGGRSGRWAKSRRPHSCGPEIDKSLERPAGHANAGFTVDAAPLSPERRGALAHNSRRPTPPLSRRIAYQWRTVSISANKQLTGSRSAAAAAVLLCGGIRVLAGILFYFLSPSSCCRPNLT